MFSGCFPRFLASRIHCRRLVFLFSMVCVEGAGWTGVILPDKVAVFRWILFVFSVTGRLTRGDTGVEEMPGKTCRQEWRHGTSGDARHVACPLLTLPTFRSHCSRRGSVFRFVWRGWVGCKYLKELSVSFFCFYVTDRAGFGSWAWRPNTWQARMPAPRGRM